MRPGARAEAVPGGLSLTSRTLWLAAACAVALTGCAIRARRPIAQPLPRGLYPPAPNVLAIPNAVPRYEPRSPLANPPFYEVDGHRYHVLPTAKGYVARGIASWYGPKFTGQRTATGERYNMYAMTAASKTLPLPCFVRVTNLENGRRVVVRVNDRGPFVANRLIDLSYAAAAKLGMLRSGTAFVEVRAITPVRPATPQHKRIVHPRERELFVQVGAFADPGNAWRLFRKLRRAGFHQAFVLARHAPRRLYRVRLGPLANLRAGDALKARLAKMGITRAILAYR